MQAARNSKTSDQRIEREWDRRPRDKFWFELTDPTRGGVDLLLKSLVARNKFGVSKIVRCIRYWDNYIFLSKKFSTIQSVANPETGGRWGEETWSVRHVYRAVDGLWSPSPPPPPEPGELIRRINRDTICDRQPDIILIIVKSWNDPNAFLLRQEWLFMLKYFRIKYLCWRIICLLWRIHHDPNYI